MSVPVRGLTLIEVEGRAADRIVDTLAGFTEVSAIHTTNGKWDLIVELGAQSLTELDAVLRRIRLIPRDHGLGDQPAVGDSAHRAGQARLSWRC